MNNKLLKLISTVGMTTGVLGSSAYATPLEMNNSCDQIIYRNISAQDSGLSKLLKSNGACCNSGCNITFD